MERSDIVESGAQTIKVGIMIGKLGEWNKKTHAGMCRGHALIYGNGMVLLQFSKGMV